MDSLTGFHLRFITYDLELKEFWTRSYEKNVGGMRREDPSESYERYSILGFLAEGFR